MVSNSQVEAFVAGYITALCLTTPDWTDWGVPLSINCCSIDLINMPARVQGPGVEVIVFHPGGRREEFVMVPQLNMYGDPEWVREKQ